MIIVGAGPAGTATAISLQNSGLSVALLDKAVFPRDKICGDALSVDVINQLKILSPLLSKEFHAFDKKVPAYGVRIFSPDGNHVDVPFYYKGEKASGYISQRIAFDHLLIRHLTHVSNVRFFEDCEVISVKCIADSVQLKTNNGTFNAAVIVGSDGAHSVIGKELQPTTLDKKHYSAGLRVYYEGVTSFHPENFIELHFFKNILPGYLWIFPLPNNRANVGIGVLSSVVSKSKIKLRQILDDLITTDDRFKERFRCANALETVKGFGLPLGSRQRKLSGDRFLLTGDAASLIDPFSGEGIANAIRSGRIAASHITNAFQRQDFSASFNLEYDREIYRRMGKELRLSYGLQKLCRYPFLFNFIVKKANNSPYIRQFLIEALANVEKKKSLLNPRFYWRMVFGNREYRVKDEE